MGACKWQCFALDKGLAWGTVEEKRGTPWWEWHARKCGGRLVQLLPANTPPTPAATPPDSAAGNGSCTRDGDGELWDEARISAWLRDTAKVVCGPAEYRNRYMIAACFVDALPPARADNERLAGEVERLRGDHNALRREADRMAAGICLAIDTKQLDSRSHAADAVLDYCEGEPWSRDKCWRVLTGEGSDGE